MKGIYDISKIKRLSEIKEDKDIKQLSYAQFPGTHCPLFGSIMTATYVEDLVILVMGTEECTYYAKDFAYNRQKGKDKVISFVINKNDVVFGCQKRLEKTIYKIDKEISPKAILVITTCVVELIGEDIESILYNIKSKVKSKLLAVKTEHFKCNSHILGIERTLEVFTKLMGKEKQNTDIKTVNILGYKYSDIEKTELYKLLNENNIKLNMSIPSKCTIDGLYNSSYANLNIVTDFTALNLAKKMKKDFSMDYVYFDKYLQLDEIERAYKKIENTLNIDLSENIKLLRKKAENIINRGKEKLKGKKFIYGNTPMNAFQMCNFLCGLGMEPLVIQARELYENDHTYINKIKEQNYNPYISRIANVAPLRQFYSILETDYYIGHENPMELIKRGINQSVMDQVGKELGFSVPTKVVQILLKGNNAFDMMKSTSNIPNHAKRMMSKIKFKDSIDEKEDKYGKSKKKIVSKEIKQVLEMEFVPDKMKQAISKMDNISPEMFNCIKMMKFIPNSMLKGMMNMCMKGETKDEHI